MNILYLTEDYYHSKVHNNLIYNILEQDKDLKIYVFTPIRNNRIGSTLEKSFKHHKRLVEVAAPIDISLKLYRLDFWAKIRCKVRLIEQNVPIKTIDAIHCATLFTEGCVAQMLNKKYNIPYSVTVRGTDCNFYSHKMFHLWFWSNKVIRKAGAIIYVTPTIKNKMMSIWHYRNVRKRLSQGIIINNGIDNIWLENKHVELCSLNESIKILYIGRFDSNKNVLRLIEAINGLRTKYPIEITLIGGDGDQQHLIENEISMHGEYIHYLGKIYDKERLMSIVRENDIFAMVSHGETFGLVYAECLTQGLPLLYTLKTGFDNMYSQGYVGYGVNSYSKESIEDGLIKIINEYDQLRKNVSQLNFDRYSWGHIAKKYHSILSTL